LITFYEYVLRRPGALCPPIRPHRRVGVAAVCTGSRQTDCWKCHEL